MTKTSGKKYKDEKRTKKGGSVQKTMEEIIESSKLPPAEQALLPKKAPDHQSGTPKKGTKEKGRRS